MPPDTASIRDTENVPVTKLRNLRVDNYLWTLAGLVAKRRRETVSQILKSALVVYTERYATDDERARAAREADQ